jgi:predicted alpha/beta superfamily hydrolase
MIGRREEHHDDAGRALHVSLPEGYDDRPGRFPVLVCLDAQWTFGTVCDSSLNLGLARLLPRVVVVGVGWSTPVAREVVRQRAAAYTPTEATIPPFVAPDLADAPPSGGGPAFRTWLLDEALPFLEDRYRIDPDDRTFIGHSLSGLFGLYTLFTRPDAFGRWLLASPSSWWDDRVIFGFEERSRLEGPSLQGRVFLSVGSEESMLRTIPMIENTQRLHARLAARQDEQFETTLAVLDGELHHSTIPAAVSRGLRWLFR